MDESRPWPRFELIGGELIVTPAPSGPHQTAVFDLARLLAVYCERERVGVVFVSPADLELLPDTITQPDVFVVPYSVLPLREEPFEWPLVTALRLAVETISPGSARTDRIDKRDLYLEANVEEYWVLDVDARMVERWFKNRETPIVTRDRLVWHPAPAGAPLEIDLEQFFRAVALKLRRPNPGFAGGPA
jgi:Uma2 family endonuclease